jgi:hypothetical protein
MQTIADLVANIRSTRLARDQNGNTLLLQERRQALDLARFSASLRSFKGDKHKLSQEN